MSTIMLRPAQRSDIPDMARIANVANSKSVIHKRIAPRQSEYPLDYYNWRLKIIRQRFATPSLRSMIAYDKVTGQVLGQATWVVEGVDTELRKAWVSERDTWANWLEMKLVLAEKKWSAWTSDRSIDYGFLKQFGLACFEAPKVSRPPCLHCHLIVVDPEAQSKGVGRVLIEWAKEVAQEADLPIYLESNLEATGFYEKVGLSRLTQDVMIKLSADEVFSIPAYVLEGDGREGRWLIRDEKGCRWRDDVANRAS